MRLLPVACIALCAVGCKSPPPPEVRGVIVPPDATLEAAAEGLDDVVALADLLGGAGLIPVPPGRLSRSGLEAAGILPPVAIASRAVGGVLVSARLDEPTRLQLALAQVLPEAGLRRRRVVGQVDAVVDAADHVVALVRGGNGSVLVVVQPVDATAEAAMLEALATGALAAPRRDPRGMTWRAQPTGPWRELVDGDIEGTLERRGQGVVARSEVGLAQTAAGRSLVQALAAPSSPAACAADDAALAVLHIPAVDGLSALVDEQQLDALPGSLDAFSGRLTVALLPPPAGTPSTPDDLPSLASLAVIGRPRPEAVAGLRQNIDAAIGDAPVDTRVVGVHRVRTVGPATEPWRRLSVVIADDIFAAGLGAPVVVDRVAAGAACPPGHRILSLHGPAVMGLVERAAPELRLVRRLAGWTGAGDPLALLAGVESLTVDAAAADDDLGLILTVGVDLAKRPLAAGAR